jgi:hypothetical protein
MEQLIDMKLEKAKSERDIIDMKLKEVQRELSDLRAQ